MLLGSNRDHIPMNRKLPQNTSFNPVEALKRKGEIYALNINSKVLHYTMCFRLNLQSCSKKNTHPLFVQNWKERGNSSIFYYSCTWPSYRCKEWTINLVAIFCRSVNAHKGKVLKKFIRDHLVSMTKTNPKYEENKAGLCLWNPFLPLPQST